METGLSAMAGPLKYLREALQRWLPGPAVFPPWWRIVAVRPASFLTPPHAGPLGQPCDSHGAPIPALGLQNPSLWTMEAACPFWASDMPFLSCEAQCQHCLGLGETLLCV